MDLLSPLGALHPDEDIQDWLVTEPKAIAFLDNQALSFTLIDIAEDPAPQEFVAAIEAFMSLPLESRQVVQPYLFQSYQHMLDELEEFELEEWDLEIEDPSETWNFIEFQQIYVSRRAYGDKAVYISVEANCEWEPEHGLQLVYRAGSTLVRVSEQDGSLTNADAFALEESEDCILYHFD